MAKVHLSFDGERTICSMDVRNLGFGLPITRDPEQVECSKCKASAAKRVREGRARLHLGALYDADEQLPEAPFEPSAPYAPRIGARTLSSAAEHAVAASVNGTPRPRAVWRSPVQALAELAAYRTDGVSTASTSDPGRFDRVRPGKSSVSARWRADTTSAVSGQVERLSGVMDALERAFKGRRTFSLAGEDGELREVELSVDQQRALLVWWAVLVHSGRGEGLLADDVRRRVSAQAYARWGLEVTARQVQLVQSAGLEAVRAHLRQIGEMHAPMPGRRRKRERSTMALMGFDLSGWGEISREVGLSERTCRRLSERAVDPLPIHRVDGVGGVHARRAEIEAWVSKNSQSSAGAA